MYKIFSKLISFMYSFSIHLLNQLAFAANPFYERFRFDHAFKDVIYFLLNVSTYI